LVYHPWIRYEDANGHGACEPEAYAEREEEILLFEVKLTACRAGHAQLSGLYGPLLSALFGGKPVRGLQIARALHAESPGPAVDSLSDFLYDRSITIGTLHVPDIRFL